MPAFVRMLASGSLGNALLAGSNGTRVLIDMGMTQQRLRSALEACETEPEDLAAVLVTHTHRDHFSTAAVGFCLARRIPVYSTEENLTHLLHTMPGFRRLASAGLALSLCDEPVVLGDIVAEAFDVPHDAPGRCVGYRLTLGPARARQRVSVATDLGYMPADALPHFLDATVVVLESNHDTEMLRQSRRPADLKARIAGPHGHLSNASAAENVAEILGRSHPGRVREVVLAHLSRDCNTPGLALEAHAHLARSAGGEVRFTAAAQFELGPVLEM
jgi:phosphoribosyl 1,2-cyclic phosphodiesterase